MAENLKKAEAENPIWFAIALLLGALSSFLFAFVVGPEFLPISILVFGIVFTGVSILYHIWYVNNHIFLNPDWKTFTTGRRSGFIPWHICMFQDIGNKRQDYLNAVADEMIKKEYKQLKEIKPSLWGEERLLKGSNLIFEDPDGTYVGIRTVSVGDDLRVGFNVAGKPTTRAGAKAWGGLLLSMMIGFIAVVLSFHIIGNGKLPLTNVPVTMLLLTTLAIFIPVFSISFVILLKKFGLTKLEPKELLLQIGESMGSKQIAPFKRILVKY